MMNFQGTQIAIDMYECDITVIGDQDKVKAIIEQAVADFKMDQQAIHFNDEKENDEYSYLVPCKRGHINIHVYPQLGFVAADVFTVNTIARPESLAKYLREAFAPDKSKITLLQRGDFGSQDDMKPSRRNQIKTFRRASRAGKALKKLLFRPKSM